MLAVTGHAAGPHLTTQPVELLNLDAGPPPAGEIVLISDGTDAVTVAKGGVDDNDFALLAHDGNPSGDSFIVLRAFI